ncbi:sulfurtransferase [Geomonas terrae]|uniref:Sulfurtransferase n=1 Tax=Geomonas terrae TaxID=2562681 RepID=A0A4S1CMT2_9BACT|nr:YceI family protein [Geomonas terrae]TGU75094.1 sulfurtransferase [Geomonas terrae]
MSHTLSSNQMMLSLQKGAVVIDVMTPEDYAACHVAGALNACVYEIAFLDLIAELVPDRNRELILYDATGTTRSAELAYERLQQAGYAKVSVLAGGLAAWRREGLPLEVKEKAAPLGLRDGAYRIDTEKSTLEWIGRNLNKRHYGRIGIKAGELSITDGKLSRGHIELDMTSISNLDLLDDGWRDVLIRHLKSDDFFAVDRFPTASFTSTGWETREENSLNAVKGIVTGELKIRDVTREIRIPATIAPLDDGGIQAHAAFDLDRTLWNACYGSCRLFERLGMHFVDDLISLELFVVAGAW